MNDKDSRTLKKALGDGAVLFEPGTEVFFVMHTGNEGLVPPPIILNMQANGGWGTGYAHGYGPFVDRETALEWQRRFNKTNKHDCRVVILDVVTPAILAIIGNPAVPLEIDLPLDEEKDGLN